MTMLVGNAALHPARGGATRRHHTTVLSFWTHAPLLFALVLRVASEPTANLSFAVLAAYALCGRAHAIRALAFSWLFSMMNPGLAPAASLATIGRFAVLFAAAFSVLLYGVLIIRDARIRAITLFTLVLGAFIIGHSFAVSPMVDVSVLKALSWTVAMATVVSAWLGLGDRQRAALERELFMLLVAVLVLSLLLAATQVGYLRNARGLQGVLNQPQAFGPTMALLGAWAAARMLGERRPGWGLVGLVGLCLVAVLLSQARTAGLAMVLGLGLAVLFAPGFAGRPRGQALPGLRSRRVHLVMICALLAGLAMAPRISDTVLDFVSKGRGAEISGVMAAYERSRGRLMDAMLANIAERPMTGIGFGIGSDLASFNVRRDPMFGLPIGASIEKGVTPLMVLEELGAFGALLVALWALALMRGCARGGLAPFAVCLTVMLLNFGEATLFSPGGFGLITLVLLGWAYSAGRRAERPARG